MRKSEEELSKELQEVVTAYINLRKKSEYLKKTLKKKNREILAQNLRFTRQSSLFFDRKLKPLRTNLRKEEAKLNIENKNLMNLEKESKQFQTLKEKFRYLRNEAVKELAEKNKDYKL